MPVPPNNVDRRAQAAKRPAPEGRQPVRRPPQRPAGDAPRAAAPAARSNNGGSGGGGPRRPAPRPAGSNRPRSRGHMLRRWVAVGLAVVALLFGAVAAWGIIQFNRIDRVAVDLAEAKALEPQNFLVVGSDTRELGNEDTADAGGIYGNGKETAPGGKRADTILIARVDPKKTSIELLSIPRDLWVDTKAGDGERINSAYNDGAQNLVDTIERNLGIPINHYVEVNFNGFKGLVEAVGGVPLYFDRPVRDTNTGLNIIKKGCYTLDGVQALAFARSRHLVYSNGKHWISDGSGDLGRITRQQVFLRHALAKVTAMGLNDIGSVNSLVGVAVGNVKIDDTLGTGDIVKLARKFSSFDASTMVVHRLSTSPFKTKRGADVLRVSQAESQPVLDIFSGKAEASQVTTVPTTALTPAGVTVDVMNGAGIGGLAGKAADRLKAVGFNVGTVGNLPATTHIKATTVLYGTGGEAQAVLLSSKISPNPAVKLDDSLAAGKIVLELVSDINVPGAPAAGTSAGAVVAGTSVTTVPPTTVATSGTGTVTPEKTVGLNIGDPPAGVTCG